MIILLSSKLAVNTYVGQTGFHDIVVKYKHPPSPSEYGNVIKNKSIYASGNTMGYISSLRVETNFIRDSAIIIIKLWHRYKLKDILLMP